MKTAAHTLLTHIWQQRDMSQSCSQPDRTFVDDTQGFYSLFFDKRRTFIAVNQKQRGI